MPKIIGNINGITLNQALYNQVQTMWFINPYYKDPVGESWEKNPPIQIVD